MRIIVTLICTLILFLVTRSEAGAQSITVKDIALKTAFQDTSLGHYKRGRACIAADFNLDGYVDFYMGNPGDESYLMVNTSAGGPNRRIFVPHPLPLTGLLTWGAVAFDYDNDGDYDLFVPTGGTEGIGFDILFRNEWLETGTLQFTDVSETAGIRGLVPEGETDPIPGGSANAVVADYDLDGDIDIFVNGNFRETPGYPEYNGRNILWRNNSDGSFTDVTIIAGLSESLQATRHSTFFDFDNDGDADLYENNFFGCNILWRNNGNGTFTDVTDEMSPPGEDLSDPTSSFASASSDFNNDGWDDLIVFMRGRGIPPGGRQGGVCDCSGCNTVIPFENVQCDGVDEYPEGHALFINQQGTGFINVALDAGINDDFVSSNGVMGCQIGDVNGDGTPDIYVGNGGPPSGEADRFYVSNNTFGAQIPTYTNETALIDYPAQVPAGFVAPPYPYRTHGIAIVDIDNNGSVEIAVSNGGPVSEPDIVREPDRLFSVRPTTRLNYLKVRPVGNGTTVSKDAVGSRIIVTARTPEGTDRIIHKTLFAGSAFSGQNGFDVYFGLGNSRSIESIEVRWPDGTSTIMTENITINSSVVIVLDQAGNSRIASVVSGSSAEVAAEAGNEDLHVGQNYPNPFNPTTMISYDLLNEDHVTVEVYNVLGERIRVLVDQVESPGTKAVLWDGRNNSGQSVASGLYMYRVSTGSNVIVRKMLLSK